MLDSWIDNIFVLFSKQLVFQWIRIVPNYSSIFLPAYEEKFPQGLLKNKDRKLAQTFNSSFRYIVDVLSLNKSRFDDYLYLIYPNELEVMDTINTSNVFFLPWHWIDGRLGGRLKQKSTANVMALSSVAIFQRMELHNPYVILGFMPSTVIF